MAYKKDYDGQVSAIITDAYVFEGMPIVYRNLIVYASHIDDYDVLIGMNLISESDFFITSIDGHNHFAFDISATGNIE